MSDLRELLDAHARELIFGGRPGVVIAAIEALRAVLDLHVPDPAVMAHVVCKHCVAVRYPCPTVQAITTALEAE